jgi:hypothetical protein
MYILSLKISYMKIYQINFVCINEEKYNRVVTRVKRKREEQITRKSILSNNKDILFQFFERGQNVKLPQKPIKVVHAFFIWCQNPSIRVVR